MTRFTTTLLLSALFFGIPGSFAVAGEPLPGSFVLPKELKKPVEDYFTQSDKVLDKLDDIMAEERMGEDHWKTHSRSGYALTRDLETAISRHYRGSKRPGQLDKWIDDEKDAWSRVKKIGINLAWNHDVLLAQIQTVDKAINEVDEQTKKYKRELAEFDDIVKRASEYDAIMRGGDPVTAISKLGLQKAKELYRDITGVTPDLKAKVTLLFKESEEVKTLRKEWDSDVYMAKAKQIIRERVDPDQKGAFRIHEAHWESQLEALAKQYDTLFKEYDEASKWLREIKEQPVFPSQKQLMLPLVVDYLKQVADQIKQGIDHSGKS